MRYEVIQTGAGRLMIVFAGWSTRPSLYRGYIRSGFDLMVVYDYSDVEFPDVDCLKEYREICVVAWSFGVAVAHRWLLSCPDLPITRTLAVNGTPWPVDDRRGIPCRVFGLTLRTLSERSVGEFRKRMFAVSDPMPDFEPVGVEHLRGELESISRMGVNDPAREDDICVWDKVIVSKSDRIIPFAGQMEAWHGHPDMTVTGGAHFPDWTQVMAMASVDKDSVERNFSHGAPTYDGAATVQRAMAGAPVGDLARGVIRAQDHRCGGDRSGHRTVHTRISRLASRRESRILGSGGHRRRSSRQKTDMRRRTCGTRHGRQLGRRYRGLGFGAVVQFAREVSCRVRTGVASGRSGGYIHVRTIDFPRAERHNHSCGYIS